MMASWRQYLLLAVLAGSLVVVLTKTMGVGDDPAETSTPPSNQAQRPATTRGRAESPVVDLGLERLRAEHDQLHPAERNPFRFRPKPPPPVVRQPAPAPEVIAPPAPTGPPPPPPILLKYIGFADAAGPAERVGVFSDGRGLVVNAKEGDILEGRYRVLRVGTDSADLVYLDGRGRQTIRLSGQ